MRPRGEVALDFAGGHVEQPRAVAVEAAVLHEVAGVLRVLALRVSVAIGAHCVRRRNESEQLRY